MKAYSIEELSFLETLTLAQLAPWLQFEEKSFFYLILTD